MHKTLNRFTKIITYTLLIIAMVFITFQTIELLWESVSSYIHRFSENEGLHSLDYNPVYGKIVLVLFFNVLLTLEILETIRVFNQSHTIKVKIILLVCLIAVSRQIFLMDIEKDGDHLEDFGVAALILALSISYFLVSRQTKQEDETDNDKLKDG